MSNLETAPAELTCAAAPRDQARSRAQVLYPRAVPLGGPRAMTVHRTLPQRARSLIGAWCFADHYGPDDVAATGGMRVDGHPHTELQTVSWLFRGEVEHRDTIGTHSFVRPGELNVMTAGSGIAHSEHSTGSTTVLHGAQLWVALPESRRLTEPAFEHYVPPELQADGARVLVFLGSLLGHTAPVTTHSPLLGAEITVPAGRQVRLDVDPGFEHGVLVDTGQIRVLASGSRPADPPGLASPTAEPGQLIYLPPGADSLSLQASADGQARVLLLGGEPLGEQIVMWWNFIARSHDEIVAYRAQWQVERERARSRPGPFGQFPGQWESTLPAPELPNARLRPRG